MESDEALLFVSFVTFSELQFRSVRSNRSLLQEWQVGEEEEVVEGKGNEERHGRGEAKASERAAPEKSEKGEEHDSNEQAEAHGDGFAVMGDRCAPDRVELMGPVGEVNESPARVDEGGDGAEEEHRPRPVQRIGGGGIGGYQGPKGFRDRGRHKVDFTGGGAGVKGIGFAQGFPGAEHLVEPDRHTAAEFIPGCPPSHGIGEFPTAPPGFYPIARGRTGRYFGGMRGFRALAALAILLIVIAEGPLSIAQQHDLPRPTAEQLPPPGETPLGEPAGERRIFSLTPGETMIVVGVVAIFLAVLVTTAIRGRNREAARRNPSGRSDPRG
jgi:hypothetical protein